jgi:hypothetical protein
VLLSFIFEEKCGKNARKILREQLSLLLRIITSCQKSTKSFPHIITIPAKKINPQNTPKTTDKKIPPPKDRCNKYNRNYTKEKITKTTELQVSPKSQNHKHKTIQTTT